MQYEHFICAADGAIPNSALPVIIYRGAHAHRSGRAMRDQFAQHGWIKSWVGGIYDYHHYHSTAHEALSAVAGEAEILVGGKNGRQVTLTAGDVLILPAGTGHKCISAADDFSVVGAYPANAPNWDVWRGTETIAAQAIARGNINAVPLPGSDPVFGKDGAVTALWRA